MKRIAHLLLTLVLGVGLLTACGGTATPESPRSTQTAPVPTTTATPPRTTVAPTTVPAGAPQYGGNLTVILRQAPRNLTPALLSAGSPEYARPAFEGLLRLNDKGEAIGVLATEWKFSAD